MNTPHFDAVLFDCDGVLVDSEPITNGVLRDMLAERGWLLTMDECMLQFVGKAVSDEAALIEQKTGMPVTDDWLASFRSRRNTALQAHVTAIPNVTDAVHRIHAGYGGRIACASGADRMKVLVHDGIGFWLAARRLHQGHFVWPNSADQTQVSLTRPQLDALVLGLPWSRIGEGGIITVV